MPDTAFDFSKHLRRQLNFIAVSCREYDRGNVEEAIRVAAALRVLFHNGTDKSVLAQMGKTRTVQLISSFGLHQREEKVDESLKLSIPFLMTTEGFAPPLGEMPQGSAVPISKWWNEIVIVQPGEVSTGAIQTLRFSRRDVVLLSAHEDGGAHLKSSPEAEVSAFRQGLGSFASAVGEIMMSREVIDHHFLLLRQFGHEVLNSPDLIALALPGTAAPRQMPGPEA